MLNNLSSIPSRAKG